MKTKRLIVLAVMLLAFVLPLVAASVTVTWNWSPSVSGVKYFRYQVGGEAEDGWTVVSSDVVSYSLTEADGSEEYTLYLQQSYDGKYWSPSATATSTRVVPTPATVEASIIDAPVAEPEAVVEEPAATEPEAVVEEEVVVVEEPVAEEAVEEIVEEVIEPEVVLASAATVSTVAGDIAISAGATEAVITYPLGYEAYAADFVDYINQNYADIASYVTVTAGDGCLIVAYPELANQAVLDVYTNAVADEISVYIEKTIAAEIAAAEAAAAEAAAAEAAAAVVEEAVPEVVEAPVLYSEVTLATAAGEVVISATATEAVIAYPAAFDVYAVPFISYLEANYPEILTFVSASNASGKILVTYPELISQEYLDLYTEAAAAEIERYIEVALATASPLFASRVIAVEAGDIVISATGTLATVSYPAIYSDYAAEFVTYLNVNYPDILSYVSVEQQNDLLIGTYAVEITDQKTLDIYADALAAEIEALLATVPAPVAPVEEAPVEEEVEEVAVIGPVEPVAVKADKGYDLNISVGTGLAGISNWGATSFSFDKEITANLGINFENIGNWFDVRIQAGLIADNTIALRTMVDSPSTFFHWHNFEWRSYLSVLIGANWHNENNMIYVAVGPRFDMFIGGRTEADKPETGITFGSNLTLGVTGLIGYRHNFNEYYGLGVEVDYTHRLYDFQTKQAGGKLGDWGIRAFFAFSF